MLFVFKNLVFKNRAIISIGTSTSISAIIGLFAINVLVLHLKGNQVKKHKKPVIVMLVLLLILSLLPDVDMFGHLGGLISGGLIGGMALFPNEGKLGKVRIVLIVAFSTYTIALCCLWFL